MEDMVSGDSSLYSRYLLGRARHFIDKAREKELAPYHISPRQATTLFIIYHLGQKATLAELARQTERGINTLSPQMTILEKDGFVKKVRETPKSNRLSYILTYKGLKTYELTNKPKAIKKILSVLTEDERQQLISMMKKIINKAEKY
jgi:DNA-binding MarR family transcriptional regulator